MNKYLFVLLLFSVIVSSCSEVIPLNQFQDIAEVCWKRDGNGMLTHLERANGDNGGFLAGIYSLYDLTSDGSLSNNYHSDENTFAGFSFTIFLSDDGKKAVTQMGLYDVYEVDLESKIASKRIDDLQLIAVSSDCKYVVGTFSPPRQPVKTVTIYDISTTAPRKMHQFDVAGIKNNRGIWLDSSFAIAVTDSVGYHIEVFDTSGMLKQKIANADISNHNIHFDRQSKNLYFRNNVGNVVRQNVISDARSTVIAKNTVQNFDVTNDETILVYSILETDKGVLYKHTLSSGDDIALASDVLAGAYLSPREDKVAYISLLHINNQVVKVVSFNK